jgi:hypothetical protein
MRCSGWDCSRGIVVRSYEPRATQGGRVTASWEKVHVDATEVTVGIVLAARVGAGARPAVACQNYSDLLSVGYSLATTYFNPLNRSYCLNKVTIHQQDARKHAVRQRLAGEPDEAGLSV